LFIVVLHSMWTKDGSPDGRFQIKLLQCFCYRSVYEYEYPFIACYLLCIEY